MNFLGIGPFELLLILVIATIVLGPERMAQAGRTLGRLYGQYRLRWQKDVDEMTRELRRELEMLQQEVEEIRQSAESEITAAQTALEGALNTEIDLDPIAKKVDAVTSGSASGSQPNQEEIVSSPREQGDAAEKEDSTTAQTSAPEDQASISNEQDPPAEDSSPAHATEKSSAEGDPVADIDSSLNSQESLSEAQETAHVLEPLSETSDRQSTHSETGEVEGDYS